MVTAAIPKRAALPYQRAGQTVSSVRRRVYPDAMTGREIPPALVVRNLPEQKETYAEAVRRMLKERQARQRRKYARTLNSPARRHFDGEK